MEFGLAVVESQPASSAPFAAAEIDLVDEGLNAVVDTLTGVEELLADQSRREVRRQHAVTMLRSVEDDLLSLACATTTPPGAAALLVQVRDDLSGSLLAALLVDEAETTPSPAGCAILQRAVATAIEGLATFRF